jgi:hypothetical protein
MVQALLPENLGAIVNVESLAEPDEDGSPMWWIRPLAPMPYIDDGELQPPSMCMTASPDSYLQPIRGLPKKAAVGDSIFGSSSEQSQHERIIALLFMHQIANDKS